MSSHQDNRTETDWGEPFEFVPGVDGINIVFPNKFVLSGLVLHGRGFEEIAKNIIKTDICTSRSGNAHPEGLERFIGGAYTS